MLDVSDKDGGLGNVLHASSRALDDLFHVLELLPGWACRIPLANDIPLLIAGGLSSHIEDSPRLNDDAVRVALSGRHKDIRGLIDRAFHGVLLLGITAGNVPPITPARKA